MIRIGPLLWLVLVALASIGTFQLKYRVQAQEQELTRLDRQIQRDRDDIQVLHAEWAHLNEPNRLSDLARRHLDLAPVSGVQIVRFEALPDRPIPTPLPDGTSTTDPIATLLTQLGIGETQANETQGAGEVHR
jgi:cell division protein FtsL